MKKTIISLLSIAAALVITGCAKQAVSGINDANKRYFDAWMQLNYPDARPTDFGIYILENEPGTGAEVTKDGFAMLDYIATDLQGNIAAYTYKETAEQLGTYAKGNYYGVKVQPTAEGSLHAGLLEALVGMQVGGHRKVIIPTWLMSYQNYSTEEEYLGQATDYSTSIFNIKVADFTMDINQWQFTHMVRKFNENDFYNGRFKGTTLADTTGIAYGMFYKTLTEVAAEEA